MQLAVGLWLLAQVKSVIAYYEPALDGNCKGCLSCLWRLDLGERGLRQPHAPSAASPQRRMAPFNVKSLDPNKKSLLLIYKPLVASTFNNSTSILCTSAVVANEYTGDFKLSLFFHINLFIILCTFHSCKNLMFQKISTRFLTREMTDVTVIIFFHSVTI